MEELATSSPYPFWYLDNVEILLTDYERELGMKCLDQKASAIGKRLRKSIHRGLPLDQVIDESVELITRELRPSCFGYVCSLVASEFPYTFLHWCQGGQLANQIRMLTGSCRPLLTEPGLSQEKKGQRQIFYALRACARHYLETSCQLQLPGSDDLISGSPKKKLAYSKHQKTRDQAPPLAIRHPIKPLPGSPEKKFTLSGKQPGYTRPATSLTDNYSGVSASAALAKSLIKYSSIASISFLLMDATARFHRIDPCVSFCLFAGCTYFIVKLVGTWKH